MEPPALLRRRGREPSPPPRGSYASLGFSTATDRLLSSMVAVVVVVVARRGCLVAGGGTMTAIRASRASISCRRPSSPPPCPAPRMRRGGLGLSGRYFSSRAAIPMAAAERRIGSRGGGVAT